MLAKIIGDQKSATKNNETIVRCNQEVGQWTDRNSRNIQIDWQGQILEKDDSVERPSGSIVNS